jgi:hypothetical protein
MAMDKPIRVEGIDVNIQLVFRPEHIPLVTAQFDKVGLNPSLMGDLIDSYVKSGELVSYERWFLEYGQRVINPLLNIKLNRAMNHPTFNNLLKHALKEVIEESPILKYFAPPSKPD